MTSMAEEEKPVGLDDIKKERPVRKRRRVYGDKLCQVCGDKALAHHFGTLACETCKAFFRRNATSKESRKCLFSGDCPITVKTRRFCPTCRLAKCFRVGMRAELILDDEEKKERMLKMSERKSQKGQKAAKDSDRGWSGNMIHSPTCAVTTTGREIPYSPDQVVGVVEQAWQTVADVAVGEMAAVKTPQSVASSAWSPEEQALQLQNVEVVYATSDSLDSVQDTKVAVFSAGVSHSLGSPDQTYSPSTSTAVNSQGDPQAGDKSQRLESSFPGASNWPSSQTSSQSQTHVFSSFQHVPRDALPSDPYMYWRLTEEERCLLTQLSAAYQDTLLSVLKKSPPREVISSHLITPQGYLQECELEARNVISFSKRMEDFRILRQDEQIALLKASTCQVLGIRSCALYIAEKDAWLTRHGYFTAEHCKMLLPNHPLTDPSMNYCRTIKAIVKNDVTLYALLHCVILFDPCDERIIDRQLINSIRDKYIILLRHYLESVYSYSHSEKYLMALQENLIVYRNLCREGKPLIKKFFPSIPNKLLVELMDLE